MIWSLDERQTVKQELKELLQSGLSLYSMMSEKLGSEGGDNSLSLDNTATCSTFLGSLLIMRENQIVLGIFSPSPSPSHPQIVSADCGSWVRCPFPQVACSQSSLTPEATEVKRDISCQPSTLLVKTPRLALKKYFPPEMQQDLSLLSVF